MHGQKRGAGRGGTDVSSNPQIERFWMWCSRMQIFLGSLLVISRLFLIILSLGRHLSRRHFLGDPGASRDRRGN
jgi:hypothetical protein